MSLHQEFSKATQHHQQGQLKVAGKHYKNVLKVNPLHADALHLLGLIQAEFNHLGSALKMISDAININATFSPYFLNRGLVYKRMQKYDAAIKDFNSALKLDVNNPMGHLQLGDLYLEINDPVKAIEHYQTFLRFDPKHFNTHNNIGNAYLARQDYETAIKHYDIVLGMDSQCAEARSNRAAALIELDRIDEAMSELQQTIQTQADFPNAYANLGLALVKRHDYVAAKANFLKAIELSPKNAEFHSQLGICYKGQGKYKHALECFQLAQTLNADHEDALFNEAICLLQLGDFERGWEKYESRFLLRNKQSIHSNLKQPQWDGRTLADKTLFIHVEQGIGDSIQFIRYLPLVRERVGRLVIDCQRELLSLFKYCHIADSVLPRGEVPQQFDFHLPLLSLARIFNTSLSSIPSPNAYLSAPNKGDINDIFKSYSEHYKVGIVWAGGKKHKNDHNRSLDLKLLEPLINLSSTQPINFFSLQIGENVQDIQKYGFENRLYDLSSHIKDFSDTAAIAQNLDLVISVDTSVAHLSGAIGQKTWLLLPFDADFRWLLDRTDSPWYQSMRLFRQAEPGSWSEVINALTRELLNR